VRFQTEQRALLIQEIQEVEDGARAAGSQLAELQVLLGAAQKEAEEAEAQSMLQRTTELETQVCKALGRLAHRIC
jgi:hypothetical protein